MLTEPTSTEVSYPAAPIQHLFEQQVNQSPDSAALIFENTSLTYRQLNRRANQFAHYLRRCGLMRGSVVAVLLERSPNYVISLLGILKAGGTYVVIDPDYPQARIEFMLADAQVQFLLVADANPQATFAGTVV